MTIFFNKGAGASGADTIISNHEAALHRIVVRDTRNFARFMELCREQVAYVTCSITEVFTGRDEHLNLVEMLAKCAWHDPDLGDERSLWAR